MLALVAAIAIGVVAGVVLGDGAVAVLILIGLVVCIVWAFHD